MSARRFTVLLAAALAAGCGQSYTYGRPAGAMSIRDQAWITMDIIGHAMIDTGYGDCIDGRLAQNYGAITEVEAAVIAAEPDCRRLEAETFALVKERAAREGFSTDTPADVESIHQGIRLRMVHAAAVDRGVQIPPHYFADYKT